MKTIFTLLASLMTSVGVFAAKSNTILTVTSVDRSNIVMVLDGKRFEPKDNGIMVSGIEKGSHQIKVYRERNNGVLNLFGKKYEMVYNTSISMKNNTHMVITVERNGRIGLSETKIKKGYMQDNGSGYSGGGWGGYDQHEAYTAGMSDRDFDNVLKQIDKEWLESNKLRSALNIVKNNSVSAAQVKEILLLFSFENNKLELAKQAYASTVDKRNYDVVMGVFSFSSSKAELDRYIRNYR